MHEATITHHVKGPQDGVWWGAAIADAVGRFGKAGATSDECVAMTAEVNFDEETGDYDIVFACLIANPTGEAV